MTQYSGVYTLQTQGQALTSGQWCTDPYYKNTTLLLHADGVAGGAQNNTFLDSSTNAFAITRNGNTTQGSFTPYGPTWSNYIDDSSSYVSYGSSADFTFSTGDFTVEAWVFVSSIASSNVMNVFNVGNNSNGSYSFYINANGTLQSTRYGDSGGAGTTSGTIALNSWHHVAAVRSGGTAKIYINGVADATSSYSMGSVTATAGETGRVWQSAYTAQGYVSNLRVCKGTAVYTSNFTPSTAPLTSTSQSATNCVLLTCQGNRFVDANTATSAKTVTTSGTPSVQRFSPFAPQYQYTPAVIGGSGYFDGTGDYLDVAYNSAFTFAGDFTVEGWFYPTHSSSGQFVWFGIGGDSSGLVLTVDNGSTYGYFVGTGNVLSAAAVQFNAWQHVAIVRNGTGSNNITLYINGASKATYTSNTTCNASSGVGIGYAVAGTSITKFSGYISDFRVVKGTAVYTSAFTPSAAPLTAVSGTSLLSGMTNAGIPDNAMMNDLETVGNAQVSTSVVKYGSGSLAFDGSGDYLQAPHTTVAEFGSGNFTVEFWAYINAQSGAYTGVVGQWVAGASNAANSWNVSTNLYNTTNKLGFSYSDGSATTDVAFGSALTTGTWSHYAICRSGNLLYAFKDGVLLNTGGTSMTATINNGTSVLRVGSVGTTGGGSDFNGYIDDLRITKGVARYTANFQPPKVAMANQ